VLSWTACAASRALPSCAAGKVSSRVFATAGRRSSSLLFVCLYRLFPPLLNVATIVQPETVFRWHRMGFRLYWRWKSRSRGGRPKVPAEIRRLIREMYLANRLGGAPRIHGEPLKLGIEVTQSTVAKYMARRAPGSSQTRTTFFHNHATDTCRHGLPDCADGRLSVAPHFGHLQARTAAADISVGDCQSDGGVDRPSDHRGLLVERSAGLSDSGSRSGTPSPGVLPPGASVSARSAENASTISSSSARPICGGSLRPIAVRAGPLQGNAIIITKQASGSAKMKPLIQRSMPSLGSSQCRQ
jgi:hypothetical protein